MRSSIVVCGLFSLFLVPCTALHAQEYGGSTVVVPPETGQTRCWDLDGERIPCHGTGMDGELRMGAAWPQDRWDIRGDGTVRDRLTNIVWLEDWSCFGRQWWDQAMELSKTLGDGICGLDGGYVEGDFAPPSINQLMTLLDYDSAGGFSEDFPFIFDPGDIWSSTTYAPLPTSAWSFGATTSVMSYQVPKIKNQGNFVTAVLRPISIE